MNKHVAVLADLDALADDNTIVRYFSDLPEAAEVANKIGRSNLADLDKDLRDQLTSFTHNFSSMVKSAAENYTDWSNEGSRCSSERRITLALILTNPESFGGDAATAASRLGSRYQVLLEALAEVGCFFLQKGAIENYYTPADTNIGKPERAAEEAAGFDHNPDHELKTNYADVIRALEYVAPNQSVDEDRLLRPKLGAALAAAFQLMAPNSSDEQLNAMARTTIGSDAEIFAFSNRSQQGKLRIEVKIVSPLFWRDRFPFEIGEEDNVNVVIRSKLPGQSP
jgi:hypothetical protein